MTSRTDILYNRLRDRAQRAREARVCLSYAEIANVGGVSRRQAIRCVLDLLVTGMVTADGKDGQKNCYVVMSPSAVRNERMRHAAELAHATTADIARLVFSLEQGIIRPQEVTRQQPVIAEALKLAAIMHSGRLWG